MQVRTAKASPSPSRAAVGRAASALFHSLPAALDAFFPDHTFPIQGRHFAPNEALDTFGRQMLDASNGQNVEFLPTVNGTALGTFESDMQPAASSGMSAGEGMRAGHLLLPSVIGSSSEKSVCSVNW